LGQNFYNNAIILQDVSLLVPIPSKEKIFDMLKLLWQKTVIHKARNLQKKKK